MNRKFIIVIILVFIISFIGGFVLGNVYYNNKNTDVTNDLNEEKINEEENINEDMYFGLNSTTNISYNDSNFIEGKSVDTEILTGFLEGKFSDCFENAFIKTYDEFKEYIEKFDVVEIDDNYDGIYDIDVLDHFDEKYFSDHTLAIEVHDASDGSFFYNINSVTQIKNQVNVNIDSFVYTVGGPLAPSLEFNFIPLEKNIEYVNFNISSININNMEGELVSYKPIIYLYPTDETNVNVKLGYKENVTVSYPEYIDGWNVLAKPNGRLIDLDTNRELYSLYYECKNAIKFDMTSEGFIVKGKEIVPFLEEKLSILGLNDIESEEFIIYWLPILSENKYNYIRFATEDEINENMPLNIEPEPESIVRILMIYKGLEEKIDITEQKLMTPQRNGFVAVEWGATEIK